MEEINKVFPLLISNLNFVWKFHEENQLCIKNGYQEKALSYNQTHCIEIPPLHIASKIRTSWHMVQANGQKIGLYFDKTLVKWSVIHYPFYAMRMGLRL